MSVTVAAERLLAMPPIETRHVYDRRDTILYALGVGADELRFVYEEGLEALPTMAAVLAHPGFFWREPALGVDWKRILHGATEIILERPLPVAGTVHGRTTIDALVDKGAEKGAIALQTRTIHDEAGTLLATVRNTSMLRGNGGFGGSPDGAPPPHPVPDQRPPDHVADFATAANQALIYRLSGDWNPLHIDPAVAAAAGFDRPILHGLCTYGVAGRAIVDLLCGGRPARLRRIAARYSRPVYPGDVIRTEIWNEGPGRAAFRAAAAGRGVTVIDNGFVEFDHG